MCAHDSPSKSACRFSARSAASKRQGSAKETIVNDLLELELETAGAVTPRPAAAILGRIGKIAV